jgi:hypothetical protein
MTKKTYIILGAINISLFLGQLVFSATRATDGEALSQIHAELSVIKQENQDMKAQIYALTSLETIQARAGELQLTRIATQFVSGSLPVAAVR